MKLQNLYTWTISRVLTPIFALAAFTKILEKIETLIDAERRPGIHPFREIVDTLLNDPESHGTVWDVGRLARRRFHETPEVRDALDQILDLDTGPQTQAFYDIWLGVMLRLNNADFFERLKATLPTPPVHPAVQQAA